MKGRISAILIVLCVVVVLLSGCVIEIADSSEATDATESEQTEPIETEEPFLYAAKIIGTEIRDGIVIVEVEWTNNSDQTTRFDMGLYVRAFQNGVELPLGEMGDADKLMEQYMDIRPGASLTVWAVFELRGDSDGSDIEIEVVEYEGAGGRVIAKKAGI